jgi:hypothetical protein
MMEMCVSNMCCEGLETSCISKIQFLKFKGLYEIDPMHQMLWSWTLNLMVGRHALLNQNMND